MENCSKNIMKFGKKSARLSKNKFDSNPVYNEKYIKTKI